MIDNRLQKLITKIKGIHMHTDEKQEVLDRVFLVIDKIEAVSMRGDIYRRSVKSPFVSQIVSYIEYKKFVPAFAIAAFLLMSGGVSLAAERALPGDALFNIKKVNEEVLGLAAVTPEAKGKLAVEVSERRLQEAATLSAQGKLNVENKAILQVEFKKQADQVKNQVASLVSQNNLLAAQEVAVNYESSLKAHEVLLEKVSTDTTAVNPEEKDHITALLVTIKDELATSTVSRVDLQNKERAQEGDSLQKVTDRLVEVVAKIAEVRDLKDQNIISTENSVTVTAQITQANLAVKKANDYISKKAYDDAFIVIQQAGRAVSDAQSIILAEKNSHFDVKKAIETGLIIENNAAASSTSATSTPAKTTPTPPSTATTTATTTITQQTKPAEATSTSSTSIKAQESGPAINTTSVGR